VLLQISLLLQISYRIYHFFSFVLDIRRIQAELTDEVVFPGQLAGGGFCPSLPAGRNPTDSTGTTNNGWTLVGNPYNDDESSTASLPFAFDLFGTSYTDIFINNNGNLSFGQSFVTFTASGFPVSGFPMVAPFWADVDTRPEEVNGRVWQQTIGSNKFAVAWDHVGYYPLQGDKRNTFMVLISDGTDAEMGLGNNVCFCYEDMEWTTGSASGGVNGFDGTPATVGVNEGSGNLGYFQIGRYNEAGSATSAGIDNLNGQSYCFYATGVNVPPIVTGAPEGNMVSLECDEPLDLTLTFAAPEGDDTTVVAYTLDGVSEGVVDGLTVDIQDGTQTASVAINWMPSVAMVHVLELVATDTEGGVTTVPLTLTSPGACKTCQERLTDSLGMLYSYLRTANWWREWRTALKASWAKTYIWWAVNKDGCDYKLYKANKAVEKLGCPVDDASPFSEICEEITLAADCLEAECAQ